jgi:hypothetical protein
MTESKAKKFFLAASDVRPLIEGMGACFATDRIMVEGCPVRFMYREEPDNKIDSGWRFLSGDESDAYMDDPANHGIYDVNTVANYDPSIIAHLDAPIGSAFEKLEGQTSFVEVPT